MGDKVANFRTRRPIVFDEIHFESWRNHRNHANSYVFFEHGPLSSVLFKAQYVGSKPGETHQSTDSAFSDLEKSIVLLKVFFSESTPETASHGSSKA
jgi:hypothetical protein